MEKWLILGPDPGQEIYEIILEALVTSNNEEAIKDLVTLCQRLENQLAETAKDEAI